MGTEPIDVHGLSPGEGSRTKPPAPQELNINLVCLARTNTYSVVTFSVQLIVSILRHA